MSKYGPSGVPNTTRANAWSTTNRASAKTNLDLFLTARIAVYNKNYPKTVKRVINVEL